MVRKRNVCVLTGTRAEYGLLRSLMRAVRAHPKLRLQTLVTGMHLVPAFGRTIDRICADGFDISAAIPMYKSAADRRSDLPAALARLVDRAGRWLVEHRSDFIVVLGDRVEALGGALAGLTANVPIAHLHGGELAAGDLDDRIRFSISALAALHFVATRQARDRLILAGEPADRIAVVGAMAMDEIFEFRQTLRRNPHLKRDFRNRWNLPLDRPMVVVLHHPCGFGSEREYRTMTNVLRAVRDYSGLVVAPNNDPGHAGTRRAIREFFARPATTRRSGTWRYADSLAREEFLLALGAADLLVGNSSSGILEANPLGTPVVNVGPRQAGRQRNGNAVFDAGNSAGEIQAAVYRTLEFTRTHNVRPSPAFGTGTAGPAIARTLAEVRIDRELLVKPRA